MIQKHLLARTFPMANEANVLYFKDLRITVLADRLFRIEKNTSGNFHDDATQSVWYRNMPPQNFSVKTAQNYLEITTDKVTLHAASKLERCFVLLNGRKIPLNNEGNLKGTTRTLDMYDGDIHATGHTKLSLGTGVCSRSGVAVVDDTTSLRLTEDGKLAPASSDVFDIYVFAYGQEYREAVKALYSITGRTPMLPRFAFGNWWSRYHAYSDEEYLHLMDQFHKKGIPLTVATVDMDWHYSTDIDQQKGLSANGKIDAFRGTLPSMAYINRIGWTGYSWNKDLFPDYRKFLEELHKRNLKVTLNLHPAEGVRFFEDMYPQMAEAMGIDPATEQMIPFDITNDTFIDNYFKLLHHPYEREGVDFWWIDWQQGTQTAIAGLDPLWALNHYHYLDNGRDGKHALIMSRYAGIGSHRYPMGFSGDTTISWETLRYMPYFTATATNIGYTWWGHDIGGHHMGIKDDELYLRFLQFGAFNPINRMHCTDSPVLTKEPWAYENGIGELAKETMVFRHRMIPYLHTCNWRNHHDGLGLMEPMYYAYPQSSESYEAKDQYLFGGNLIVAPVLSHSEEKSLSRVKVWLPEGTWTDIFTGDNYTVPQGGSWKTVVRALNTIPVFAKSGTVLPLSCDTGNGFANPQHLEARVYNGTGSYTLYEDDELGKAAFTVFENVYAEGVQTTRIRFSGDLAVLPEKRDLTVSFQNIVAHTSVDAAFEMSEMDVRITVLKNGEPISFEADKYAIVSVTLTDIDYTADYEVRISYRPADALAEAKRVVLLKLQYVQGAYSVRNKFLKKVLATSTFEELIGCIEISDLHRIEKDRLLETLL